MRTVRGLGTTAVVLVGAGLLVVAASTLAVEAPAQYEHRVRAIDAGEVAGEHYEFEDLSAEARAAFRGALESRSSRDRTATAETVRGEAYVVTGRANAPPEFTYPGDTGPETYDVRYQGSYYRLSTAAGDSGMGLGRFFLFWGSLLPGLGLTVAGLVFVESRRVAVSVLAGLATALTVTFGGLTNIVVDTPPAAAALGCGVLLAASALALVACEQADWLTPAPDAGQ